MAQDHLIPCWATTRDTSDALCLKRMRGVLPPVWRSSVDKRYIKDGRAILTQKSAMSEDMIFLLTSLRELNPWLDGWENNQEKP